MLDKCFTTEQHPQSRLFFKHQDLFVEACSDFLVELLALWAAWPEKDTVEPFTLLNVATVMD